MTQANTDPLTWPKARMIPLLKRRCSGKIAITSNDGPSEDANALVESQQVTVGRDPSSDVVIPLGTVSKRHAYFTRRDRSWWLTDVGSSNGTAVDGQDLHVDRAYKIVRTPARVQFGSQAAYMFLTPETLFEFLATIRRVHGIEEPESVAAPVNSRTASAEDFASIAELPVDEADAFSRVLVLSRSAEPKTSLVPPAPPTGRTEVDPAKQSDDARYVAALRAVDAMGDLVERIDVVLDTGPQPLELFRKGNSDQLKRAKECLDNLRPRVVRIRLTSSLGDGAPYDIYVRR
jgi:hypothetical protein